MEDIKTQAATLVNQAPVADEVKQGLLAKLEKEGATDDFMVELKVAVGEAQAKLNRDNKASLGELAELDRQEETEQAKVYADFEAEMTELEAAADDLTSAVTTAQKEQSIADERKKLDAI